VGQRQELNRGWSHHPKTEDNPTIPPPQHPKGEEPAGTASYRYRYIHIHIYIYIYVFAYLSGSTDPADFVTSGNRVRESPITLSFPFLSTRCLPVCVHSNEAKPESFFFEASSGT
jgi:hypothetical protein